MENTPVHLRPAVPEDRDYIAWGILTAVGFEAPSQTQLQQTATLCLREDVLYSYRNTFIAEYDGKVSGMLCCYPGEDYLRLRGNTFPLIAKDFGVDFSGMEAETGPGEFYLDSVAVFPEFRRRGIAGALLLHGMRQAASLGIARCTLVVSPEKPMARKLYESLGFRYEKELFVFNETYQKMVCMLSTALPPMEYRNNQAM